MFKSFGFIIRNERLLIKQLLRAKPKRHELLLLVSEHEVVLCVSQAKHK